MVQQKGQMSTAETMANKVGITYSCFNKVAWKIKMAGFIESVQGSTGGYRIAENAYDITVYDVIKVMEGDICINRCLGENAFCSRKAILTCPVHKTFADVQNKIIGSLQSVKLKDLCVENQI